MASPQKGAWPHCELAPPPFSPLPGKGGIYLSSRSSQLRPSPGFLTLSPGTHPNNLGALFTFPRRLLQCAILAPGHLNVYLIQRSLYQHPQGLGLGNSRGNSLQFTTCFILAKGLRSLAAIKHLKLYFLYPALI